MGVNCRITVSRWVKNYFVADYLESKFKLITPSKESWERLRDSADKISKIYEGGRLYHAAVSDHQEEPVWISIGVTRHDAKEIVEMVDWILSNLECP